MAYIALYRQWRPQDFEQLVGQEHISTTLKNAITSNRIAHAYLFSGPRGTGKTSTAKIMAKALNCLQGPTIHPCNACDSCKRIIDGSSMDVLEIDAASNRGIDEIRELREKVKFTPVDGRYKVYIIDEVHMLTTEAFNALLKTLEEPPAHAIFILATTEPHKIPATILSRCQRYDFRRIDSEAISGRLLKVLQEMSIEAEPEALGVIANFAEGGLRDALSILDQCIAFSGDRITVEDVRSMLGLAGDEWLEHMRGALLQRDVAAALGYVQELISLGKDARQVILELLVLFRDRLVESSAVTPAQESGCVEDGMEIMQLLSDAAQEAKWAPYPRIVLEVAVIRICRRGSAQDMAGLAARLEKLEAMLANKMIVQPAHRSPDRAGRAESIPPAPAIPASPPVTPAPPSTAADNKQNSIPPKAEPPQHLEELEERILAELLKHNKRAIHTCLSEGRLLELNGEQAVFGFQLAIYKERIEKDDYRGFLEKLVSQMTGERRHIKCRMVSDTAGEGPGAPPVEATAEDAVVRHAKEMFGEKVVTIVNNNKGEEK